MALIEDVLARKALYGAYTRPCHFRTSPGINAAVIIGRKHSDACGVQPGMNPPDFSDEWEIRAQTLCGLNQRCVQCSAGKLTELWRASAVSSRGGTCTDYWVVRVIAL